MTIPLNGTVLVVIVLPMHLNQANLCTYVIVKRVMNMHKFGCYENKCHVTYFHVDPYY